MLHSTPCNVVSRNWFIFSTWFSLSQHIKSYHTFGHSEFLRVCPGLRLPRQTPPLMPRKTSYESRAPLRGPTTAPSVEAWHSRPQTSDDVFRLSPNAGRNHLRDSYYTVVQRLGQSKQKDTLSSIQRDAWFYAALLTETAQYASDEKLRYLLYQ